MPISRENQFAYAFSPVMLERGREVFQRQKVLSLACEPFGDGGWVLSGQVAGTSAEPYDVEILLDPGKHGRLKVASSCSCPVGMHCKHAAALLFAQLARNTQIGSNPGAMQEQQALSVWLGQVNQLLRDKARREDSDSRRQESLFYVLQPSRMLSRRYRLTATRGRIKLDGQLGKLTPYTFPAWSSLSALPTYVQETDVPVLMLVQTLCDGLYQAEPELHGQIGARLLLALAETGRCFWLNMDGPTLHLGEPIAADLLWTADAEQRQQPRLTLQDGAVLPVAPPFLLNESSGRLQPLVLAAGDEVAELLALAPPLSGEALLQEIDVLGRLAPTLPRPEQGLPALIDDVAPQPVLVLRALPVFGREAAFTPDGRVRLAQVQFDYAGSRIASHVPDSFLTARQHGKVVQVRRQASSEQAWLAQLPDGVLSAAVALDWLPQREWPDSDWTFAHQDHWLGFLEDGIAALERQGWRIEGLPEVSFDLVDVEDLELAIDEPQGTDWFDVALDFRDGPKRINLLPLIREHADRINELGDDDAILLPMPGSKGRLYRLPVQRARMILGTLTELVDRSPGAGGTLRLPRSHAYRLLDLPVQHWRGGSALRQAAEKLRSQGELPDVQAPAAFRGTLRPYQQTGLNWLQFGRELGLNGVLADDMGLGKTVQTLAHLSVEKAAGRMDKPSLLVVPTSLIANWRHEAERFAPQLRVLILHGTRRAGQFDQVRDHDLVISTYPLMSRDQAFWQEQHLHYLILDEAQAIKNQRSQAAITLRSLQAHHRLCLTGTPMENHLGELWSLMDFLNPGLLGDDAQFRRSFRKPIEQHNDDERRLLLQKRVAPFLLRRKKEDVAKELPPKIEVLRTLSLDGKQRDLYESLRVAMQERLRDEIARKGFSQSQIVILDALLKLRQVCCDPRLVKLDAARNVAESAKLEFLLDLIPTLLEEGRRILLFSQFTEMLALIEQALTQSGVAYVKLTGDTKDRETPVNRFQNGEVPLFLISLKAGGVGLNLTAADTVIHYDPWWNPAAENQATDRAHRIGQDKTVFVYKLVTEGTVEEKILALQDRKRALAAGLYGERKERDAAFSADDLDALFEPLPV